MHRLPTRRPTRCPNRTHSLPPVPRPPAAARLAGLSLWDPRLGAMYVQHTGAGALLTVLESDEAGVECMGPDTWPRSGMTIQDPAVPFWVEPLDVGRR